MNGMKPDPCPQFPWRLTGSASTLFHLPINEVVVLKCIQHVGFLDDQSHEEVEVWEGVSSPECGHCDNFPDAVLLHDSRLTVKSTSQVRPRSMFRIGCLQWGPKYLFRVYSLK